MVRVAPLAPAGRRSGLSDLRLGHIVGGDLAREDLVGDPVPVRQQVLQEDLLAYRDRIANEVLAREITADDVAEPKIAKA